MDDETPIELPQIFGRVATDADGNRYDVAGGDAAAFAEPHGGEFKTGGGRVGGRGTHDPETAAEGHAFLAKLRDHPPLRALSAEADWAVALLGDVSKRPAEVRSAWKDQRAGARARLQAAFAAHAPAAAADLARVTGKSPAWAHAKATAHARRLGAKLAEGLDESVRGYLGEPPEDRAEFAPRVRPSASDVLLNHEEALDEAGLFHGGRGVRHDVVGVFDRHFLGSDRSEALREAHHGDYGLTGQPPVPEARRQARQSHFAEPTARRAALHQRRRGE